MNILGPTRHNRLNEAAAFVYAIAGVFVALSLVSYFPQDPSWNTAAGAARAHNLTGPVGAHVADLLFQLFGLTAFGLPALIWALSWKWVRSRQVEAAWVRLGGSALMVLSISTGACLATSWRPWHGAFASGGVIGTLLADSLITSLNPIGTALVTGTCFILSMYLLSTFSMTALHGWLAGPNAVLHRIGRMFSAWQERWRAALEGVEPDELRAATRVLERLGVAFEDVPTGGSCPEPEADAKAKTA